MKITRFARPAIVGTFAILLATACKDEQRLYSYDEDAAPATPAQAAPQGATSQLPAGHPPLDAAGQLPAGHPPLVDQSQLPAGHPPLNPMGAASTGLQIQQPPADRPGLDESVETQTVELTGITMSVPANWTEQQPANTMRLAQMLIPSTGAGLRPADFVVFYFGRGQGGDAMSNVSRWIGQMDVPAGVEPEVYQQKKDEFTVTEVYVPGTLKSSTMGGAPTPEEPNSALYGLIIEGGPQGSLFIKVTGPEQTIKESMPAFVSLIDKLEVAG